MMDILKKIFASVLGVSFLLMSICSASEILATTATEENPWSLSLMKVDENKYVFLVFNVQTEQGAFIPYRPEYYNFYLNDSPFIFLMVVKDSPKNVDNSLGEWREDMHLLPVYALFNYADDQVNLESYLSSCNGLSASHYQAKIQSPYHTKLAEVFLTQMPALHKAVENGGVKLP